MFSALKFVAASVIVALFGGFLLTGVLTAPDGEPMPPAAVTASPEPEVTSEASESADPSVRTDILPGVGLTVEEVEPGVFRVMNDGVRDLRSGRKTDIVAGHDDGIWLLRKNQFFRLGSEAGHAWPDAVGPHRVFFEVTPDGTVWVIGTDDPPEDPGYAFEGGGLLSFDGDGWTATQSPPDGVGAIEAAPDGTLWASWWERANGRWEPRFGHLGPSGLEPLGGDHQGNFSWRLYATDSGVVYAKRCGYGRCRADRYEDSAWHRLEGTFETFDVSPDGTVWHLDAREGRLRRFAGAGSPTSWGFDELPDMDLDLIAIEGVGMHTPTSTFNAAPDGSMWASLWQSGTGSNPPGGFLWKYEQRPEAFVGDSGRVEAQCDGLVRFDGTTTDRFLPGRCVTIDIAADGSVWVLADEGKGKDLYVITPEAVAATEATTPPTEPPTTSLRTDILPGVALTVEEVEPDVLRVVSDGVRNLAKANSTGIVAGHDGSIYLLRPKRFLRLGEDESHRWATNAEVDDFEVAPDGTVWASPLESFDGKEWTTEKAVVGTTFDMTPDGTLWASWEDPEQESGQPQVFAYLDEDGWQTVGHLEHVHDLLVADPDDIWATRWYQWPADLGLIRHTDGSWQRLVGIDGADGQWQDAGSPVGENAIGLLPFGIPGIRGSVDIGPDGTLWAVTAPMESADLIRFDGSEWSRWPLVGTDYAPSPPYYLTRVAPDASFWVGLSHGIDGPTRTCHGVGHFDGVSWERYLPNRCVAAIDIAADGSVWLLAMQEGEYDKPLDLYVITPEAVAAGE
jgi:hypothetical protein